MDRKSFLASLLAPLFAPLAKRIWRTSEASEELPATWPDASSGTVIFDMEIKPVTWYVRYSESTSSSARTAGYWRIAP